MSDLDDKKRFENTLRPRLREYHNKIVTSFVDRYPMILDVSMFDDELNALLSDHYTDVTASFSNRLRSVIDTDVAITKAEASLIAESLILWTLTASRDSTRRINATTQDNVLTAVELGLSDPSTRELVGIESEMNTLAIAKNDLKRKLRGRESGVLMTETQIPAETAKATESEVLSGTPPSISGGTPRPSGVLKEWVSVGDHRVRMGHLSADGQRVRQSDPFVVSDELLRWPGDAGLGASIGNIINCRCSSVVRASDITRLRREL